MKDPIIITYCFNFDNGIDKTFSLQLDRETLDFVNSEITDAPEWVKLSYNKCTNCPLSEADNKYCPVAYNLKHLTKKFSTILSHENVFVSVITEERTYKKRTTIEEAFSSLMVFDICQVLLQIKKGLACFQIRIVFSKGNELM